MPAAIPSATELREALLKLAQALRAPEPMGEVLERLVKYAELVATWNQRVDLTAAKRARELVEVLFADALVLADEALVARDAHILDVGTGVGAPIVPLVLLRGDVSAQALEPRRKRVAFLRTVVGQLELVSRLSVIEGRVELNAEALPAAFGAMRVDVACSRATFAPSDWLPLALRLAPRAVVLAARDGLPSTPDAARLIGQREYALPSSGARRVLGIYARQ